MKALVVGATGLVGQSLLSQLLDNPQYDSIHVIARSRAKQQHAKLFWHVCADFMDLQTLKDSISADHVYCCLGTTMAKAKSQEAFCRVDRDHVVNVAKLGLDVGASKFMLVSSLGANPESRFFYNRVKGQTEGLVSQLPYQTIGIFRPSVLKGQRQEWRPLERLSYVLLPILNALTFNFIRSYLPVEVNRVAKAMQNLALSDQTGVVIVESSRINL